MLDKKHIEKDKKFRSHCLHKIKHSRIFTIVDRSVKDFTPAKGKPSWPFNKWGWKLLKLPSEPDQAKKKRSLELSTNWRSKTKLNHSHKSFLHTNETTTKNVKRDYYRLIEQRNNSCSSRAWKFEPNNFSSHKRKSQ